MEQTVGVLRSGKPWVVGPSANAGTYLSGPKIEFWPRATYSLVCATDAQRPAGAA